MISDWMTFLTIGFALAFLIVGVVRIVEFDGLGLSNTARRAAIIAHLVGCVLFTGAMAVFALDPHLERKSITYALFVSGLALLFPTHIYAGLKRRLRLRALSEKTSG